MHRHLILLSLLALSATSAATFAADATSGATADPVGPSSMRRLASRIEPDLMGKSDRLAQYVHFFSKELANDSRLCAFNVAAEAKDGKHVTLTGFVEFPETRSALKGFLGSLGFEIADQLETLPQKSLGKEIFGLVKTTHSYGFDKPAGRRKQENDCLLGEPLLLLREQDGQLLVHSHEGYLAYVASEDVRRLGEAEYAKYIEGPRVRITVDQQMSGHPMIPAGARLKRLATEGDRVRVEMPTGESVDLPGSACKIVSTPNDAIDEIVAAAQKLIGTPYFWGGRTSEGIDCSGLVQMGYAAAGLHLPRDAYQQFYIGQLTATRWHMAGMRRGDTLYFLADDGKIRHTALYLGNGKFIQAVMPYVTISSLNPGDPEYDEGHAESFAFAKRLLD